MKLYSTLSGVEEEFVPSGSLVKMYVCGITPYAPSHIGHALSYVVFDVLRRYLEFQGYHVRHVQNFTDIDDKIIDRASLEGVPYTEISSRYIEEYNEVMGILHIKPAHEYPLATESIPRMIQIIGDLIDKQYAYAADGDVYFRVTKDEHYGKLSRRSVESMIAGARVEPLQGKEHPMDFTLWKSSKPGEPSWESPWGYGRPGWHIECSAIALDYLGPSIDIHGGGLDLVFPHHENEIAQSESHTGVIPFSRHWVHNGLLNFGENKMSKSLGNLVTVSQALKHHSVDALRLYFLSSHYRSPLNYSELGLSAMERAVDRLRTAVHQDQGIGEESIDPSSYETEFFSAMDSDLNTPQAIAALFNLAHKINRARDQGLKVDSAQQSLRTLGGILGLTLTVTTDYENLPLERLRTFFTDFGKVLNSSGHHELENWIVTHLGTKKPEILIETLLAIRQELRQIREYELADSIRHGLVELGISVEDSQKKTTWAYRPNPS